MRTNFENCSTRWRRSLLRHRKKKHIGTKIIKSGPDGLQVTVIFSIATITALCSESQLDALLTRLEMDFGPDMGVYRDLTSLKLSRFISEGGPWELEMVPGIKYVYEVGKPITAHISGEALSRSNPERPRPNNEQGSRPAPEAAYKERDDSPAWLFHCTAKPETRRNQGHDFAPFPASHTMLINRQVFYCANCPCLCNRVPPVFFFAAVAYWQSHGRIAGPTRTLGSLG